MVEMGQLMAGPFCGQLLGDYGADVIKLEDPERGDPLREWGYGQVDGRSLWWPIAARNKQSVTCDLRTPGGQDIARRLIARADILIENFRPGTLERWGMAYETLREANPRLILVRVSGFGQTGPYARRPGYASVGEAMGGLRQIVGYPDRPPARCGISLGDSLAASFACMGALSALHARERTGEGQVVDVAIYESVLAVMESLVPDWALAGHQRQRSGPVLPDVVPSNIYPTADGDLVVIAANADSLFKRLGQAMDAAEWAADASFATHRGRVERAEEIDGLITAWTSDRDTATVLETLEEHAVPASRIFTAADMLEDAHFAAREAIVEMHDERFGAFPMPNVFPRFVGTPTEIRWLGPELGQHTDQVLAEELGYTSEGIDALRAAGCI